MKENKFFEDNRRYKSKVSDWINSYGKGTTKQEKLAMEYIAQKIYEHYNDPNKK